MKKLLILLILSCIISACRNGGNATEPSQTDAARQDSLALKVALMPTMDCLPFYYAERNGLFKELDLDVCLLTYNAQMDCDTAFMYRHADMAYTDLIRAALLQSKGIGLQVLMQADGHHRLLTAKNKRIQQARHLKERMVAIARHSVTDLLLDTVIAQAGLDPSTVYHPQINDIQLRYGMLHNATIDAAFLPEPYATQARLEGCKDIYDSGKQHINLMAFMASEESLTDKRKTEQLGLLLRAYNKAVHQINQGKQTGSTRKILLSYPVGPETADSLAAYTFHKAENAKAGQLATALHFLHARKLITADYTGDTLINTQFIP